MTRIIIAIRFVLGTATACLALAPGVAFAHPGLGPHAGLALGFIHPLTGADHILAMVAVGILAATLGGRALWALPLAFLAVVAFGGELGISGVRLPLVELVIALSVVIMGLAVALPRQCSLPACLMMVGSFALYHGYAHGTEMAQTVSAVRFVLGFVIATGMLHAIGIGLGIGVTFLSRTGARFACSVAGLTIATVGIGLLISAV